MTIDCLLSVSADFAGKFQFMGMSRESIALDSVSVIAVGPFFSIGRPTN